jgi:hypothetical protein
MTDTYEARGPHLPDIMTRQSPWVWLFVGAALVHLAVPWLESAGSGALVQPQDLIQATKFRLNDVLISLFGAALFVRHPDARRSLPLLAFGLGLMALGPLLRLIDAPMTQFLDSLSPSGEAFMGISPAVIAFHVVTSLVSVAAITFVAVGLAGSRRHPKHRRERLMLIAVTVVSLATVAVMLVPFIRLSFDLTPFQWTLLLISHAVSLIGALARSYLIAVTFGGWLGGEAPPLGWAFAFGASVLGLIVGIVNAIFLVIAIWSAPVSSSIFSIVATLGSASWILFLAAFAVGLPATDDRSAATPLGSAAG